MKLVKTRSDWSRGDANPMTGVLMWGLSEDTDAGRSHMMAEAEVGAMLTQARELQGLLANARSWKRQEGFSPESSEGVWPGRHLGFRLLASRLVRG